MKALSKNTYYVKETTKDGETLTRIWHNCEKYKNGRHGIFRVELAITENDTQAETLTYTCPHCGFKYVLDMNLNLA